MRQILRVTATGLARLFGLTLTAVLAAYAVPSVAGAGDCFEPSLWSVVLLALLAPLLAAFFMPRDGLAGEYLEYGFFTVLAMSAGVVLAGIDYEQAGDCEVEAAFTMFFSWVPTTTGVLLGALVVRRLRSGL